MSTFLLRSSFSSLLPQTKIIVLTSPRFGNSAFKLPNSNRFVSHIRNCETLYYEITELLNTRREMSGNEFRFFLSCDINLPLTFRIERLEGTLNRPKSTSSGTFSISIFRSVRFNFSINQYSSFHFNFFILCRCWSNSHNWGEKSRAVCGVRIVHWWCSVWPTHQDKVLTPPLSCSSSIVAIASFICGFCFFYQAGICRTFVLLERANHSEYQVSRLNWSLPACFNCMFSLSLHHIIAQIQ